MKEMLKVQNLSVTFSTPQGAVQAQLLGLLRRMQKRLDMSVLLITHDLGVVAGMAGRGELYVLPGTLPDLRLALDHCPFAARCRYAMPVCRRCMPEETGQGHKVSCWLADERAPRVNLMGGGAGGTAIV